MRGEFLGVWSEMNRHVWEVIALSEFASPDLYCDLFREISRAFSPVPTESEIADIIFNSQRAKEEFESITSPDFASEGVLVKHLEAIHEVLDDLGGDALANLYFTLVEGFVHKFSLRYELRRPMLLCPTIPGMFTKLMRDLRTITNGDPHLASLMNELETAIRDLHSDQSDGRIKTCLQKQFNLIEGLASCTAGITPDTLGAMCNQLKTWPHPAINSAAKNLYGFASDYPGLRHGTKGTGALRAIDMRDLVAITVILAGFVPYLSDRVNADLIYREV
jgi:hypothetical protein